MDFLDLRILRANFSKVCVSKKSPTHYFLNFVYSLYVEWSLTLLRHEHEATR